MRIAIDATPLYSQHKYRGIGVYTRELISSLQKYEKDNSYNFFVRGKKIPKNMDLIHYPYFDPFFLTLPLWKPHPTVVTVHDLVPIVYPDKFDRGIRGEFKWRIQRMSLSRVNHIIVDSRSSRNDVMRFIDYPNEKISIIYLAPPDNFKPMINVTVRNKILDKYKLSDNFILYVGDVNWNKNVPGLLNGFSRLLKLTKNKVTLVLVGKAFLDDTIDEVRTINQTLGQYHLSDMVIKLGYVPDSDLIGMYSAGSACVQPSFAEGFGLTALEAMACGCPVVISNRSSLSEIAGPAIRIDPEDHEGLAKGLYQVLNLSPASRKKLSEASIAWARRFSWRKVARQTAAVYKRFLQRQLTYLKY